MSEIDKNLIIRELRRLEHIKAEDRLIFALDFDRFSHVRKVYEKMFLMTGTQPPKIYKVGLQLITARDFSWEKMEGLAERSGASIFLDLKIGADIDRTIERFISHCRCYPNNVIFISIMNTDENRTTQRFIEVAKKARNGPFPKIIGVPLLSNRGYLDEENGYIYDKEFYVADRELAEEFGNRLLGLGCEGLVISGAEPLKLFDDLSKREYRTIITPGIRLEDDPPSEHTNPLTPREATRLGADYLVVGRAALGGDPPDKKYRRIIDEMQEGFLDRHKELRKKLPVQYMGSPPTHRMEEADPLQYRSRYLK